ncbi:TMEM131 [Bugula neritina]|uniref:TMEM131 n=1 Tax=Bugula neritina TaxID=10212 RepID=A0A7J7KCC9_BUGNE|nr:TMEM131 [Bugula neritina]
MAISQGLGLHFLMMTWKRPIASIFCTFILHTLTRYSDCAQNNGEVFIQTDNELRFMIDGIPLPISTADSIRFSDDSGNYKQDNRLLIQFDPPILDFGVQPVGVPSLKHVTVVNTHETDNIQLLSISGKTRHFHCSFFRDKTEFYPPVRKCLKLKT